MKLRNKLTLLTVSVATVAIVLCVLIIMAFSRENAMDGVTAECTSDYQNFITEFMNATRKAGERTPVSKNSYLVYQFRSITGAGEFILQAGDFTLTNNTGIDAKKALLKGGTAQYLLVNTGEYAQYKTVKAGGEFFFLMGGSINIDGEAYYIALVRNISDTVESVNALAVKCAAAGVAVVTLAAVLMLYVIRRSLRPVKTLQTGAGALSQGRYESRIELKGKNELAVLADSFNRMADAIEHHIREVETTSEERRMLLSALSHEMKTPVTAITGYSHALMRAKMTEEQKQEAVCFIDKECRRLERLSGKLMQLISLQGHDLALSMVTAESLFAELRAILAPIAEKENISLAFECGNETYRVERDLIVCLVSNLFDNARKAGAKHVTVSAAENVICVTDDGRGIPPEHIAKVTQPFYTTDPARHAESFGLGLSLCKRIAELHHAELAVESRVGDGTVVRLKF